jgi:hypothetical protein
MLLCENCTSVLAQHDVTGQSRILIVYIYISGLHIDVWVHLQVLGEMLSLRLERALVAMEAEGQMVAEPPQVPVDPSLEALHMALVLESCCARTTDTRQKSTSADASREVGKSSSFLSLLLGQGPYTYDLV